jgi:glycosyltransferase involved in cell wall biosynthesis
VKILLFDSGESGFGGSFKSCFRVVDILKRNGYFPMVVGINNSFYWKMLKSRGIEVKTINHIFYTKNRSYSFYEKIIRKLYAVFKKYKYFPYFLLFFNKFVHYDLISQLKRIIKEEKIELIQTNINFFKDIPVYIIAVGLNIPIICYLRTMPKRQLIYPEKRLAQYEHGTFIAISIAVLRAWIRSGIPESRIRVIYNAQPPIETVKNVQRNNTIVKLLFVGRLEKRKGVDLLIEAMSGVKNKNWILSIIGEGSKKEDLIRFAKRKGLMAMITFYGFRKDVNKFYRSHDILIVPSLNEPFGRVIIEGMSYGIAVIASDNGGIPEIIDNGKDGILFTNNDAVQLRNAVEDLISDPDRRKHIGLKGREKVKTKFSEDRFGKKLMAVYRDLLKNNK